MDNLLSASEVGRRLDVSAQTVINWCNQGRVPGAKKVVTVWLIPENSIELIERPKMGRPLKEETA